jgi:hypothetical protein
MSKEIDRATRLVITLTLFGGSWFLLKNTIGIWYQTFTKFAYTKTFISVESIFSVILLTIVSAITLKVISYIFHELKTYQSFSQSEVREEALALADKKFSDIFLTIKNCFYFFLVTGLIMTIVTVIFKPTFYYSFLIGILLAIVIFIISHKKRGKVQIFLEKTEIFQKKISPYSFLLYIVFFILFFGISLSMVSLNANQNVSVNFTSEYGTQILIDLQNIEVKELSLNIENNEETRSVDLAEAELREDLIETLDDSKTNNNRVYLKKSRYQQHYIIKIDKYLLEGLNKIEMKVIVEGLSENNQIVRIKNDIIKKKESINFSEKVFKIEL